MWITAPACCVIVDLHHGSIADALIGQPRQDGDIADMIWPVADIIADIEQALAKA